MFDWGSCPELEAIPGKVSGAWVFKNTRVPVRALFENLRSFTVEEFCEMFPPIRVEQARHVLDCLSNHLKEERRVIRAES